MASTPPQQHPVDNIREGVSGAEMVRQGQEEDDEVSEERAAAFMARALSEFALRVQSTLSEAKLRRSKRQFDE